RDRGPAVDATPRRHALRLVIMGGSDRADGPAGDHASGSDSDAETVFSRSGWFPHVVRGEPGLMLRLGAGADALHQRRTVLDPISDGHLVVIRDDSAGHLLLWCGLLPLCDAAGIRGPLDQDAAVALLAPIPRGPSARFNAHFRQAGTDPTLLVAYG